MLISEYFGEFSRQLNTFQQTGLIAATAVSLDSRTDTQGFITATIEFLDGSKLFVREYVDVTSGVDKFSYAFHYQDQTGQLIFRYDNARHRPDPGFLEPRHSQNSLVAAAPPNLEAVLEEIFDYVSSK